MVDDLRALRARVMIMVSDFSALVLRSSARKLVDVRTDREVWMLYTSFMRRIGPGLLWTYGAEADAIASALLLRASSSHIVRGALQLSWY